jgi:uncharacterized protein (TIGR02217 family)
MAIVVLNDVILPESVISAGIVGKNQRNNFRSISVSGFASVNINWSRTLRQYQLGVLPMQIEQWLELEGLHEITDGGAYGFLMQDPKDQSVKTGEGFLQATDGGYGTGNGVSTYKLLKKYETVGSTRVSYRAITRPTSPIVVSRNGTPMTVGSAAGQIAINYDTGTVTIVEDATQAIQLITVGASTVLEFANNTGIVAAIAVGQKLFISGVTGDTNSVLNGKTHVVASKDTGLNTVTISTATTGLTLTGGTAKKFPQVTDLLTWTGKFYVPVHFANDDIDWEVFRSGGFDSRIIAGQNVVLQEIRE